MFRQIQALEGQIRRLRREAVETEQPTSQYAAAGHVHVSPEFSALPDASAFVGQFIRVRAGLGQPTLLYHGVITSTGEAGWMPCGQSD